MGHQKQWLPSKCHQHPYPNMYLYLIIAHRRTVYLENVELRIKIITEVSTSPTTIVLWHRLFGNVQCRVVEYCVPMASLRNG